MKDVIDDIESKLSQLEDERDQLQEKLELKKYQLDKVESILNELSSLKERDDEDQA